MSHQTAAITIFVGPTGRLEQDSPSVILRWSGRAISRKESNRRSSQESLRLSMAGSSSAQRLAMKRFVRHSEWDGRYGGSQRSVQFVRMR